jgi:hypothetical protein
MFTPIVVACSCVVFGSSTVPLAVTMHFAELKIIAHRKYVAKILERLNDVTANDASEHWARCAAKYLRLSADLEQQAKETKWLFISMHGSFATFLIFTGLLVWSKGSGWDVLDTIVLTILMGVVWNAFMLAQTKVTTSATDCVMNVIHAYIRSIGDDIGDSPRASTIGVNAFVLILERHPTGCYLFPFCGAKQVFSRGFIAKILSLPFANLMLCGFKRLLSMME